MEQRVEAVRPPEQGSHIRFVLRTSGLAVFNGQFGASVRFNNRSRACLSSGRKRGQEGQALGRSRGGFTTKIHLKTDFDGLPIAFDLTGGEKGDAPHFPLLLDLGPDIKARAAVADKGYASKANRNAARSRDAIPVIPHKSNEKDKPAFFARAIYKGRARIEQAVGKLKRFKRVALRCAKTKRNFSALVSIAAAFILIKSVHTA